MKISYEERNGKRYAYVCTSKRVPGKKYPVASKEYLGVVDEETGEIVDKKGRAEQPSLPIDGAEVCSYGDSVVVYTVAKNLGIIDDMRAVFGDRADTLTAIALAIATHPISFDTVDTVIKASYIRQLLGIRDAIHVNHVGEAVNSITSGEGRRFFERRWCRHPGKIYAYARRMPVFEKPKNPIGGVPVIHEAEEMTILDIMSEDGALIGFSTAHDVNGSLEGLKAVLSEMGRSVECTLITDTKVSESLNLGSLVGGGFDFAIPYDSRSRLFSTVATAYRDVGSEQYRREYGRSEYYLREGQVALVRKGAGYTIIPPTADDGSAPVLNSYVCLDPRMSAVAKEDLKQVLSDILAALDGHVFDDPWREFELTAGPYMRFFKYSLDKEGRMCMTIRRKVVSTYCERAGMTLVLASSDSWEDVIRARELRSRMSQAVDQFNHGSGSVRRYVGKGIHLEPAMFLKFVAITIYAEIQRVIEDAGLKAEDAESLLTVASTYKLIMSDDGPIRSARSRKVGRIFRAFGIDDENLVSADSDPE